VNELEDKLNEVAAENAARDHEYKDQIEQLTKSNTELAKENARYKLKLEAVQKELEALRRSQTKLTQVASPAPSSGSPTDTTIMSCGGDCSCQNAIDKVLCDRTTAAHIEPPPRVKKPPEDDETGGGGGEGDNTTCPGACAQASAAAPLPKRSPSPLSNTPKRTRTVDDLDELATDFTTAYRPRSTSRTSSIIHVPDPCGFCSDDTPCVCAEMAHVMNMEDSDTDPEHRDVKLAPILSPNCGMISPPASSAGDPVRLGRTSDMDKPIPLHPPNGIKPTPRTSSSGCKPGGCDQCKNDPMSTLFCQSVAARTRRDAGCCGGDAAAGACCKDTDIEGRPPARSTRGSVKRQAAAERQDGRTYIPCSAAYQTLSRHRAFDDAAADLGALVRPLIVQSVDGSCPQVEVSSVRDVLKMLDRRFGRD